MGFFKEFKEFAMKGNIIDLAIAVIIGAAFGKIITALVDNIIMPIIGSVIGNNFGTLTTTINGVQVKYGLFIQAAVDFIIVAFVLFVVIKGMNRFKRKEVEKPVVGPSSTDVLLMEIRDAIRNKV